MAVTLTFQRTKASIDTLELDASLSERHTAKVTVTTHPVEQGAKITDHKLREPDTLVVEGLVTNDPMPDPANAGSPATFPIPGGSDLHYTARSAFDRTRAGNAYQTLLALLDSPNLIAVVTSVRSYDDMVMTDLDVPRDAQSGQALRFTATFTQVRIVQNQTVTVQAKTTRANGNQDLHKKVTPEASAAAKKKSILKSVTDSKFGQHPLDTISGLFSGGSKVGF